MSTLIAVAFVFSALPVIRCLRGGGMIDYQLWYGAGRQVLTGGEIYFPRVTEYDFIYPPTCALFLGAASAFGQCGLVFVLVVTNSIAWFVSARLAAGIAAGERAKPKAWLYFIPSFLVLTAIWSSYHLGQPMVVLLALMLGAFAALRAKRGLLAGTLLAIAASIKAFPVMAIIYLIYRRYWKAAASLVVTLVFLLLLLPSPFRGGFERSRRDLEKWSTGMLKYDAHGVGQRPWRSYSWRNQSIVGVANRLLRPVDVDENRPDAPQVYANIANLNFATVNAIIIGVALLLGIIFLLTMPPPRLRTAATDAIEFSLLLMLMLMLTPLTYSYSFSWLMLPLAVIVQRALDGRPVLSWTIAATIVFLFVAPWQRGAQAYGNLFFGTLILFAGLSLELWREKRRLTRAQSPAGGGYAYFI
jgi:glycosyl transferase family 87